MQNKHTGLQNTQYNKPELSGKYTTLNIPLFDEIFSPPQSTHPFYSYHNKPFDKERYMYSTLPIHLRNCNIDYDPDKVTNVLRCPIKSAGTREIIIPDELQFLTDFIEGCCIYETSFNNNFINLYAHITVDYKEVMKGTTHRVGGYHVDGFQGSKFPIKHQIEHSYLWSSTMGTEFCPQPYFISHIDDSKYLVFHELEKQAKECNVFKCMDKNIYLFDPYMVHRSPVMVENTRRLLVRVTFEYEKLLDPNDTVNPVMTFDVPYKYDIRNMLGEYKIPVNTEMFGYGIL